METDTRNVIDKYRGQSVEEIVSDLDMSRSELEIAIENIERDFNMGTIVRTANAFNVKKVHVIGRRQWNKRGAMKTDTYLHLEYHADAAQFLEAMNLRDRQVYAIDIVPRSVPLGSVKFAQNAVLVFGSEGDGLSDNLLNGAERVVHIEQFGSTRSINVGVAAGIAMYAWVQQYRLFS